MKSRLAQFILMFLVMYATSCKKDETQETSIAPLQPIFDSFLNDIANVKVLDTIKIKFRYEIGKKVWLDEKYCRAVFDTLIITDNNIPLKGKTELDSTKKILFFIPESPLPESKKFSVNLKLSWESFEDPEWVKFKQGKDTVYEDLYLTLKVESFPEELNKEDVILTYPINNQYCYLPQEYSKGIIMVKANRFDLFNLPRFSADNEFKIMIKSPGEEPITVPATATSTSGGYRIEFQMPQTLPAEKIFQLQLVRSNKTNQTHKLYYQYYFRTSKFKTFKEKFQAGYKNFKYVYLDYIRINVEKLSLSYETGTPECPDSAELKTGMLSIDLDTTNNLWFRQFAPFYDKNVRPKLSREKEPYGTPPTRCFTAFYNVSDSAYLTKEMVSNNNAPTIFTNSLFYIEYSSSTIDFDIFDIINKLINTPYSDLKTGTNTWNDAEKKVMSLSSTNRSTLFSRGNYVISFKYTIPGYDYISSLEKVSFNIN